MAKITAKDVQDSVLSAVEMIGGEVVKTFQFDRTVSAIVVKLEDEATGKYKVRYQDAVYYATTDNLEAKYAKGTEVYVLIPQGDFSKAKKIIGSVSEMGDDYIFEGSLSHFIPYGDNCLTLGFPHVPCEGAQFTTIFDEERPNLPQFSLDQKALKTYIGKENKLYIGADFDYNSTSHNFEDYGIIIQIENKNGSQRTCILNTSYMLGDPWANDNKKHQEAIFTMDMDNYDRISKIVLFNYNPNGSVIVTDLRLSGAVSGSQEDLLDLYVDVKNGDPKILQPYLKYRNRRIKNSDKMKYFWFKANAAINKESEKYHQYGGECWEFLQEGEDVLKSFPNDKLPYQIRYKCVVIYEDKMMLSKTIVVFNPPGKDIHLKNPYQKGPTDINIYETICINNIDTADDWTYKWATVDENGEVFTYDPKEEVNEEEKKKDPKIFNFDIRELNFGETVFFCLAEKGEESYTITTAMDKEARGNIVYVDTGYGEDKSKPAVDDNKNPILDENGNPTTDYSGYEDKNKGYVSITSDGVLTAHNVNIMGDIHAVNGYFKGEVVSGSGDIGGWKINSTSLSKQSGEYITEIKSSDAASDNITTTAAETESDGSSADLETTSKYIMVVNAQSPGLYPSQGWKDNFYKTAPFRIMSGGTVILTDNTNYTDPDTQYGQSRLKVVSATLDENGKYNLTMGTYIQPNRIHFFNQYKEEASYTAGSLKYVPGVAVGDDDEENNSKNPNVNKNNGNAYFYFTRPLALPGSRNMDDSEKNVGEGKWAASRTGIKGRFGIPVISQSYMNNYKEFAKGPNNQTVSFTGTTITFGPNRMYSAGTEATIRQTVLRGKNVHLLATGSDSGWSGYITLNAKQINSTVPINSTSDERVKKLYNIDERYYNFFRKIKPLIYSFKQDPEETKYVGYGAQSIQKALEECGLDWKETGFVSKTEANEQNQIKERYGVDELYTLAYSEISNLSVAVLQKALDKIEELEKEVSELKAKLG